MIRTTSGVALKEWAVICRDLGEGRHILLVRKGGIRDQSKGFTVEHDEFFLFPTYVHENADELIGAAGAALPEVERAAPPAGLLRLELYATVAAAAEVTDLQTLQALDGQHALAWAAVERRFHCRRPGLHVIALRVFRLPRPLNVPNLARYDGCRSWVALESAYSPAGCRAVVSDADFQRRLHALQETLRQSPRASR